MIARRRSDGANRGRDDAADGAQLRDLENELEGERRGKTGAVSQKKKMESTLGELEQQLEVRNSVVKKGNMRTKY